MTRRNHAADRPRSLLTPASGGPYSPPRASAPWHPAQWTANSFLAWFNSAWGCDEYGPDNPVKPAANTMSAACATHSSRRRIGSRFVLLNFAPIFVVSPKIVAGQALLYQIRYRSAKRYF